MSMRNYGVENYGLVFNFSELLDFIKKYYKGEDEEVFDYLECEDTTELADMFGFDYYGEFEGSFRPLKDLSEFSKYFENDDMFIMYFEKQNSHTSILYDCYKNQDEIIDEIDNKLKEKDIIVDRQFIIDNIGFVSGSYFC